MQRFWTTLTFTVCAAFVAAPNATAQLGRYRDQVFNQVSVQADLTYGQAFNNISGQQETLLLDLYEPAGDSANGRPAIVIVHGGGFIAGDKTGAPYVQLGQDFASRGYVAVSINYRLGGLPFSSQIVVDASHDLKAAVRWLRANATALRIDPGRIACIGGSAGAIMCLQAAYAPIGEGMSGNPGVSSEVSAVVSLWGRMGDVTVLETGEAPVQMIHGTNDPIVPFQSAVDIENRADAVGVPSELIPIPNASHAPWDEYFLNYALEPIGFLYEHLDLGGLAGLHARAGFASPGALTLDTFGLADAYYAIALGPQSAAIAIPGFGELCIGPLDSILILADGTLPTSPRLATDAWSINVPPGLTGVSLYWQAFQIDASAIRLTNCVQTTF